jgi:DNA-binding transcriptional ArsR family regulator
MAQIVLDAEAFKALSSDTRLQILKALDARRLTVSELGRLLNLNKATVFEHLKMLAAADLVKKEDEGRKWVYYKLTWKGRNVLHPENVQFMLLLGTGVLSVGGLLAHLGSMLSWWGGSRLPTELDTLKGESDAAGTDGPTGQPEAANAPAADSTRQTTSATPTSSEDPLAMRGGSGSAPGGGADGPDWWADPNIWLLTVLVLLLVTSGLLLARYLWERRRERQRLLDRLVALPPDSDEAHA